MQCPKDLEDEGFRLTNEIVIPWSDHEHVQPNLALKDRGARKVIKDFHKYTYKIHPLMVGVRMLSEGNSYKALKTGYENIYSTYKEKKEKRFMCYFGNDRGPKPETDISSLDYDWESDLVGFYTDKISHPNEKRAIMAEILTEMDHGYGQTDARIICNSYADEKESHASNKVIPLKDFSGHVSNFQYNFNVSGYRKSIPNRFTDSFSVGTAVVTDRLDVKWYLPFDEEEVFETVEMGYLRNDDVDWDKFREDVANLKVPDSHKIRELFEKKWSPEVVAKYIIDTMGKTRLHL